jgi:hypothetical protein
MHDNEKGLCVQTQHSMGEQPTGHMRAKAAQHGVSLGPNHAEATWQLASNLGATWEQLGCNQVASNLGLPASIWGNQASRARENVTTGFSMSENPRTRFSAARTAF